MYDVSGTNEIFTIDDLGNHTGVNVRDGNDVAYLVDNLTNRYPSIDSNAPEYDNAGNINVLRKGKT